MFYGSRKSLRIAICDWKCVECVDCGSSWMIGRYSACTVVSDVSGAQVETVSKKSLDYVTGER